MNLLKVNALTNIIVFIPMELWLEPSCVLLEVICKLDDFVDKLHDNLSDRYTNHQLLKDFHDTYQLVLSLK